MSEHGYDHGRDYGTTWGKGTAMKDRFARFAPLISGVLFVAFVVINNAQTSSAPDNSATGGTVLAYYKTHGDKMGNAGFSLALSVVAGLFFYGILRSYLRTSKRAEWASAIGFGGAIIFAAGALAEAGIDFTISDVKNNISASAPRPSTSSRGTSARSSSRPGSVPSCLASASPCCAPAPSRAGWGGQPS